MPQNELATTFSTERKFEQRPDTHSVPLAYLLWIFGFTGSHRFYCGKPISGTVWFCTFGLLGVGWLLDVFFIPALCRDARYRYREGDWNFSVAWILLTFLGTFGVHRFYLHRWISGIIWFFTLGLLGLGLLYDFWNINEMVSYNNERQRS